jgi:hypothetical protein
MAIAVVQSTQATGYTVTSFTTPGLTTTGGNLFIAEYLRSDTAGTASIADSKSNTYTGTTAEIASGDADGRNARQLYKENGAGGSGHTFTLNVGNANGYAGLVVREVSGALISGSLDQTATKNNNSGTTGMTTSLTAATAQGDEIVCGFGAGTIAGNNFTNHSGNGFTVDQTINFAGGVSEPQISASKVVSVTGTYEYTWDAAGSETGIIGIVGTYRAVVAAAQPKIPAPVLQAVARGAYY